MRYVAELDGEWVALACFSAAALHLKAREKWISWTPRQRARRLGFVVNNSRYLVLPERERLPNLASRALGLCLRRLSRDWEARWEHPLLAVESFVDETRYRGVCYRACGFEAVGPTAGFQRASRDFYHEHGEPIWLPGGGQHDNRAELLQRRAEFEAFRQHIIELDDGYVARWFPGYDQFVNFLTANGQTVYYQSWRDRKSAVIRQGYNGQPIGFGGPGAIAEAFQVQ